MGEASSRFKEFVDEVRSKCSIVDIISKDAKLEKRGRALFCSSPFRTESKPSLAVYPDTESWYDYGLGEGGDVFYYIQKKENCEFTEAVEILANLCGIEPYWKKTGDEFNESDYKEQKNLYKERREVERLLTLATAYYHKALTPEIRQKYYKEKYGLTDETIDELQLGWGDGNLYKKLTQDLDSEEDKNLLLKTGLFVKTKNGIKDFFTNRLFFPYWYRSRVVYAIGRRTEYSSDKDWDQAKYKKLLTHSDTYDYVSKTISNEWFYNEDCVAKQVKRLVITEGVTDCIAGKQAGVDIISPVTTRFREKDIPKLLTLTSKVEEVIICNDADIAEDGSHPGDEGAKKTAYALYSEGRDVRIATLPKAADVNKIDINEFLLTHTPQEFIDVLNSSISYPDFLIQEIPDNAPAKEQGEHYKILCELICRSSESELQIERYIENISKKFRITKTQIRNAIKRAKRSLLDDKKKEEKQQKERVKAKREQVDDKIRGKIYEDLDFYYVQTERNGSIITDIISSFVIRTRHKIKLETSELIVGDFVANNERLVESFVFPKSCWISRKDFTRTLPNPDLMWTGSDDNVQYLMQLLANADVPTYKGTENLGFYEDADGKRWVTSSCVISSEGIMDKPDIVYAGTYPSLDKRMQYKIEEIDKVIEVAKNVFPRLPKINDPHIILPIIGWCFSTPLKPKIQKHLGHFPILVIWGTQGSGKTSVIREVFWPLFGVGKKTDPYSVTETDFAMMRLQSSTDSIFVFLDEYKPKDMGKNKVERLHRALRRGYGGETEERGRVDLSIVSFNLNAPIALAGEAKPEGDAALAERIISVSPDKNALLQHPERQKEFKIISKQDLGCLATEIIKWCLSKKDEDIKKDLKEAQKICEGMIRKIGREDKVPIRCFDNLTVMIFGLMQYDQICESMNIETEEHDITSLFTSVTNEMLEGDGGVKNSLDRFMESLSVYAQAGKLLEGTHYTYVDDKLYINLPLCYDVYLEERRRTGRDDETNGIAALKRMAKENMARIGYIYDMGKQVNMKNGRPRCLVVSPDKIPETIDFEKFPRSQSRMWGGSKESDYSKDN